MQKFICVKHRVLATSFGGECVRCAVEERESLRQQLAEKKADLDSALRISEGRAKQRDEVMIYNQELRAQIDQEVEAEACRWAQRFEFLHTEYGSDSSGVDSGDQLDCVEVEVLQALNKLTADKEELRAQLAEKVVECQRWKKELKQADADYTEACRDATKEAQENRELREQSKSFRLLEMEKAKLDIVNQELRTQLAEADSLFNENELAWDEVHKYLPRDQAICDLPTAISRIGAQLARIVAAVEDRMEKCDVRNIKSTDDLWQQGFACGMIDIARSIYDIASNSTKQDAERSSYE